MKCRMVFNSSAAAWLGRREWAGGQPAVAPTLGIILPVNTDLTETGSAAAAAARVEIKVSEMKLFVFLLNEKTIMTDKLKSKAFMT